MPGLRRVPDDSRAGCGFPALARAAPLLSAQPDVSVETGSPAPERRRSTRCIGATCRAGTTGRWTARPWSSGASCTSPRSRTIELTVPRPGPPARRRARWTSGATGSGGRLLSISTRAGRPFARRLQRALAAESAAGSERPTCTSATTSRQPTMSYKARIARTRSCSPTAAGRDQAAPSAGDASAHGPMRVQRASRLLQRAEVVRRGHARAEAGEVVGVDLAVDRARCPSAAAARRA